MNIEIMREIVEKDNMKKKLEDNLELLKKYKEKPNLYSGHLEITISTRPCFHDEWTNSITSNLDENILDTIIESTIEKIARLDSEICNLEARLNNKE